MLKFIEITLLVKNQRILSRSSVVLERQGREGSVLIPLSSSVAFLLWASGAGVSAARRFPQKLAESEKLTK